MMNNIARKVTLFCFQKKYIEKNLINEYIYSFEIFLATVINLFFLLCSIIATKNLLGGLIFISVFGAIRINCGGFHFNTHKYCITIFNIYTFIILSLLKSIYIPFIVMLLIIVISAIIIIKVSPKECKEKEISTKEKIKYQKRIKTIFILLFIILMCMILLNINLIKYFTIALLTSVILLII